MKATEAILPPIISLSRDMAWNAQIYDESIGGLLQEDGVLHPQHPREDQILCRSTQAWVNEAHKFINY